MTSVSAGARKGFQLPQLPDKLFFSIREVSDICGVEPHVLRYWESEFSCINPVKKSGNRRYYRKRDVEAIMQVKHLLYERNFTIRGARKVLMSNSLDEFLEQPDARTRLIRLRQQLADVLAKLGD